MNNSLLKNYYLLVEKTDLHIRNVEQQFREQITCKKGCDACCLYLTLFPVEAYVVSTAFFRLPEQTRNHILKNNAQKSDRCPLLMDGSCSIYPARPLICRTHGYPILITVENSQRIDFCPENFKTVTSFSNESLLSIDALNTVLTAVNQHFIAQLNPDIPVPDRIDIFEALNFSKMPDLFRTGE